MEMMAVKEYSRGLAHFGWIWFTWEKYYDAKCAHYKRKSKKITTNLSTFIQEWVNKEDGIGSSEEAHKKKKVSPLTQGHNGIYISIQLKEGNKQEKENEFSHKGGIPQIVREISHGISSLNSAGNLPP